MMILALAASLLLVGLSQAGSSQQSNQYVDTLIFNNLVGEGQKSKIDPVDLPDFNTEFKDKFGFLTVKVKTDYKNGKLSGLTKVQRARDCSPTTLIAGEHRINCTLELSSLHLEYEGNTKYGKIPSVSIKVKANLDKIYLAVELASFNRGQSPFVRNFAITNSLEFDSDFTGLGPASSVLKGLKNSFKGPASSHVINVINNQLRGTVERLIRTTILPL